MRKIIIKLWFGVYNFNIFKENFKPERSAVSNLLLSLAMIFSWLFLEDSYKEYVVGGLFLILTFCTFIYFRIKPVKWNDLDEDIQKWYYGYFYFVHSKDRIATPEDLDSKKTEWNKLNKLYK